MKLLWCCKGWKQQLCVRQSFLKCHSGYLLSWFGCFFALFNGSRWSRNSEVFIVITRTLVTKQMHNISYHCISGRKTQIILEEKLKKLEEECKVKESERVTLELELTEVKENLKKALAGGITLGLAIEPKSGPSSAQVQCYFKSCYQYTVREYS